MGFFAGKMGQKFLWFGVAVIMLEILGFVVYSAYTKVSGYYRHKKRRET